jgi:hypothetical protein
MTEPVRWVLGFSAYAQSHRLRSFGAPRRLRAVLIGRRFGSTIFSKGHHERHIRQATRKGSSDVAHPQIVRGKNRRGRFPVAEAVKADGRKV